MTGPSTCIALQGGARPSHRLYVCMNIVEGRNDYGIGHGDFGRLVLPPFSLFKSRNHFNGLAPFARPLVNCVDVTATVLAQKPFEVLIRIDHVEDPPERRSWLDIDILRQDRKRHALDCDPAVGLVVIRYQKWATRRKPNWHR